MSEWEDFSISKFDCEKRKYIDLPVLGLLDLFIAYLSTPHYFRSGINLQEAVDYIDRMTINKGSESKDELKLLVEKLLQQLIEDGYIEKINEIYHAKLKTKVAMETVDTYRTKANRIKWDKEREDVLKIMESNLKKWQLRYRWFPYIVSLLALICSVWAIVKSYTTTPTVLPTTKITILQSASQNQKLPQLSVQPDRKEIDTNTSKKGTLPNQQ